MGVQAQDRGQSALGHTGPRRTCGGRGHCGTEAEGGRGGRGTGLTLSFVLLQPFQRPAEITGRAKAYFRQPGLGSQRGHFRSGAGQRL